MCCFLANSNKDQDDEENTRAWELYVYGSDGPSVGSRTASSGSLVAFPSGSTSKTSLGSVSVVSGNSSMMPFQNGSRTPSPGPSRAPSPGPSRAPSLRSPSPAHSLRPLGVSRSPSIRSFNSVSSLSSGRVSPLNANDVPTTSHSQFMIGFNRRLDETFNLKTRY